jgi:RNA polymerase sigma factor (TIGR02999 family)
MATQSEQVTRLLEEFTAGRREALDEAIPLVYEELHRIAQAHLARERTGHTLNTTALLHEAYIRLVGLERIEWHGRTHFLAMASRVMRRVLIDYAKSRSRVKRGGGELVKVPLDEAAGMEVDSAEELLALDEALHRLETVNPRHCRLVEYRFFGGLSLEESADALGISLATAKRDWALCRAWLNRALAGASATQDPPPSSE